MCNLFCLTRCTYATETDASAQLEPGAQAYWHRIVHFILPPHIPGRIRTADLRFRKPVLYPAELRGRARSAK